ncbi:MAG: hypothetical protein JWP75_3107 [Frondihabitans sp.]|nr:hypothetical protein [Frondihabitans sp.]
MTTIDFITLHASDPAAAKEFYDDAFGLEGRIRVTGDHDPGSGFRGYTLSLTVAQPSTVSSLIDSALQAGATTLKPVAKSFWGFGGVVRAPDGAIWKVATSSKKEVGSAARQIDSIVLLLGADDVLATKAAYVERGKAVGKSFGRKYVEFDMPASPIKLALLGRRALAKDAGVAAEGSGAHGLVIGGDIAPFVDPDGFEWASSAESAAR